MFHITKTGTKFCYQINGEDNLVNPMHIFEGIVGTKDVKLETTVITHHPEFNTKTKKKKNTKNSTFHYVFEY